MYICGCDRNYQLFKVLVKKTQKIPVTSVDYKGTENMATGIPTKAVDSHNNMVFKLGENITSGELYNLKHLLRNHPLTPVDMATMNSVQDLFTCLMDTKFISYGDYDNLLPKLELLKPVLCDTVKHHTEDISRIVKQELDNKTAIVSQTYHCSQTSFNITKDTDISRKEENQHISDAIRRTTRRYGQLRKTKSEIPIVSQTDQDISDAYRRTTRLFGQLRKTKSEIPIVSHTYNGSQTSFVVTKDTDITRKEEELDISDAFRSTTRLFGQLRKSEIHARSLVEIIQKQSIEEFKRLKNQLSTSQKESVASRSILHIVAVYGTAEMIECMKDWDVVEWDGECEISEDILEDALKTLTVSKATALYLATFLDRTEIVRSLIKYAGDDNIGLCFRTLYLSNPMEEVYMLDQAKKLKTKHSDLKPAVVPGHQVEREGKHTRVYIVYSIHITQADSYKLNENSLVMLRNPYIYTKDVERNTEKMISYEDAKRAEKAVSIHCDMLWEKHSNLNIIGVSPLKYRHNGAEIIEKPCIELYCSTKGVVPLGETEFPTQLDTGDGDYIDVDIHEGYFRRGYNSEPSIDRHSTLKMGCNIGRSTAEYDASGNPLPFIGGTLGPFVKFHDKLGFLTCAHVLFDIPQTLNSFNYTYNGKNKIEVAQPSVDVRMFKGPACGHVRRAIFDPQRKPSVDVAVVEVTDSARIPTAGRFANTSQSSYKNAGFDELPEYNSGSVQTDIAHFCATHTVFKFGSSSDVTRGTLDVCGIHVRPLSTVLGLPRLSASYQMTDQYRVFGADPTYTFFTGGDSGSAVFMKTPGTDDLVCIGMAIGYMNVSKKPFPAAVITPIGAILDALGPEYSITSF